MMKLKSISIALIISGTLIMLLWHLRRSQVALNPLFAAANANANANVNTNVETRFPFNVDFARVFHVSKQSDLYFPSSSSSSSSSSTAMVRRMKTTDKMLPLNELNWQRLESRKAIVTLITNEAYLLAGCVLASSLRFVMSKYPIVAVVTSELASRDDVVAKLALAGFDYCLVVEKIENPAHQQSSSLDVAARSSKIQAHKADVFTKLRVYTLTQFTQLLYIDADCVVTRNIDHLLDRDTEFSFAPSLQPLKKCQNDRARKFIFKYKNTEWCQSHTKELYHGTMDLRNHNAGVMLIRPSQETFEALYKLMNDEAMHDDSCIGQPGCNDQRVINVYYHDRPHDTLELTYNIFCDQLLNLNWTLAEFDPDVVHYRGGSKPWALDTFAAINGLVNEPSNDDEQSSTPKKKKKKTKKLQSSSSSSSSSSAVLLKLSSNNIKIQRRDIDNSDKANTNNNSEPKLLIVNAATVVRWIDESKDDIDGWRTADRCGHFMIELDRLIKRKN